MKFINYYYRNNFNYFFNFNNDETDNFVFFKKFIKNKNFLRKTNKGVKHNIKYTSIKRNKNIYLDSMLINSWIKRGLKINFLKNYNLFLEQFYYLIINEPQFFENYPNCDFIFDLLKTKSFHFKIKHLLKEPLKELEYIFDLKLKKLNKKLKRKLKKKYSYTINYLHKNKRLKHTLNMFYYSSNFYKNKKYFERIFFTFLFIIFDTKSTPIWERKLNVYKIALKFLNKK